MKNPNWQKTPRISTADFQESPPGYNTSALNQSVTLPPMWSSGMLMTSMFRINTSKINKERKAPLFQTNVEKCD